MVATSTTFSIEEYTRADEPQVLDLLHRCLGAGSVDWRDGRVWRWKHEENPFGPSLVLVAKDGAGRVVGLRTFMRWQMIANGEVLNAYRPVDTATDPEMRRSGVFSALTKAAIERAHSERIAFTFNTPNDMSFPGYIKMGWREVTALRVVTKITNYPRFVARTGMSAFRPPPDEGRDGLSVAHQRESVRALVERPCWLDPILDQAQAVDSGSLQVKKTAEYLRWRYLDDPVYTHGARLVDSGQGQAYCFFRPASRSGAQGLLIEDMFVCGDPYSASRQLLKTLTRDMDVDFLTTCFSPGATLYRVMRKVGFHALSRKGSHFVVNPLIPMDSPELACPESWALAMGEIEFF